jgi:tetratricopeptide (TPR) repeat protein
MVCAACGFAIAEGSAFCPKCGQRVASSSGLTDLDTILPSRTSTEGTTKSRLQSGSAFGARYRIMQQLGEGGMGIVYKAWDEELSIPVALKLIRPEAMTDPGAALQMERRFKRELVLARQVTHKHVVRIHDLGELDSFKYFTMPFIEGRDLGAVITRDGKLPVARALRIARQVASGLAAAHDLGIVHRDLKPENVMLDAEDTAVIMDFGLARSDDGANLTMTGAVMGTLGYMAPEQARGGAVDQRADDYAWGLMLYDMLAGRRRVGPTRDAMSEMLARMQAAPPAIRTLEPHVPEALEAVITRATDPDPDKRYATTRDLIAALDELDADGLARQPVVAAGSRSRRNVIASVLALVIVSALGGWLLTRGPAAPPAPREPVSVLISDFVNGTGDPLFDGVIEQALGLGIEGASFITSFPRRDALRAASVIKPGSALDESTSRLVAQREGIDLVVAGEIESRGTGYLVNSRVVQASDGAALTTLATEVPGKAQLLETIGALAGRMRTALGDTAVPSEGPRSNETFTAASLEAAKAYATAQLFKDAGRNDDAMKYYAEAITLDPGMGRAYSGLASMYQSIGQYAEALKTYEEAMQRLDRMTERERFRTRGTYYLTAGKAEKALEEYSSLVKRYPGDTTALANLAFAHAQLRGFTRALEIGRQAAEMYPTHVGRRNNVALYAMYAGQYETAIAESDAARKLNSEFVKAFVARGLSELALGRNADAVRTFEALRGLPSAVAASYAFAGLADVALYEGRTADAIRYLKEGIAADEASKNMTALAKKRVAMADALLAQGDPGAAAQEAQRAVATDHTIPTLLTGGLVLARTGRAADANRIATELDNDLEVDPQAYGRLIRAELALTQNQPRAALDHVREAQKLADSWLGRVLLGRTYLELGMFSEAESEIDTAIRRSGEATAVALQDDVPTFRYFPPLHYYKGVAQAGLKNPAANETFKTFLSIKANGDEAGSLVADARKRLAP